MKINGKQSVKLRSGSIKFKNDFEQLAFPFKIFADFESILKGVKNNDKNSNASYTKSISHIFFVVLLTKLFVLIINLINQLFLTEEKIQSRNLLKQFLEYD